MVGRIHRLKSLGFSSCHDVDCDIRWLSMRETLLPCYDDLVVRNRTSSAKIEDRMFLGNHRRMSGINTRVSYDRTVYSTSLKHRISPAQLQSLLYVYGHLHHTHWERTPCIHSLYSEHNAHAITWCVYVSECPCTLRWPTRVLAPNTSTATLWILLSDKVTEWENSVGYYTSINQSEESISIRCIIISVLAQGNLNQYQTASVSSLLLCRGT